MARADTIRILIADDHPILRKTLTAYLSQESEVQIVGEAGDSGDLVKEVTLRSPDILLLDANMPGPDMVGTVKRLKTRCPKVKILVLTASKRREQVENLVKAGVHGYVLKEDNPRELLQAIHTVSAGEEWFSPSIAKALVSYMRADEQQAQVDLTQRELEVLRLMVAGAANDEIAARLHIATNTVKNHVRNIFRKLNVNSRVAAVLYALDNHLVEEER